MRNHGGVFDGSRRQTRQPIVLWTSAYTPTKTWCGHTSERVCEVIGLKVGRVGGYTKARRIRDFCVAMGLRMNIEDTGGSVLADTAAVHLAQSTPVTHRRGTWLCHDMLSVDTAPGQGARNQMGQTVAPEQSGIGVEPDLEVLGAPVASYSA